jgi:uncharacterized membrane protein
MRVSALILALVLVYVSNTSGRAKTNAPAISTSSTHTPATKVSDKQEASKVDFTTRIRPIFESRCMPCHFAGGKMYERLPFDRAKTITLLGEKLFSRIKDEHEQRLIREFLAQQ